ncbi:hypothetical protein LIER_07355 [Lithospermum erythrorhizon]|uniref:BHLH domain-containing protein n=1 Tax=Lithospermum erythrorhizon TaxID=34254 RepID=A0AAV3PC31_LITER
MLSLSNASFPSFGWPSDDILQSNNNNNTNDNYNNDNELLIFREFSESSSHSPSSHEPQQYIEPFSSPGAFGDHHTSANMVMKKKQNHNANERHRRLKISSLYTTLRSLLPDSDQTV